MKQEYNDDIMQGLAIYPTGHHQTVSTNICEEGLTYELRETPSCTQRVLRALKLSSETWEDRLLDKQFFKKPHKSQ